MSKQAVAILEWYEAMGVDQWVEESPQNHLTASAKVQTNLSEATPTPASAPATTAAPAAAAPLKPAPKPPTTDASANSSRYTPYVEALKKANEAAQKCQSLDELRMAVMQFKELSICRSATQAVFAEGTADAPLMIIGEAPGAQEDRQGVPFCGPSGKLLDKMLTAIDHSREENAYITNSVFWRPPGNRTPSAEEIAVCQPFVKRHIELQKPQLILLLGGVAVRSVLDQHDSISRLRGKTLEVSSTGAKAVISYHPSYLLRQPNQKRLAWQDLLLTKAELKR